MKKSVCSRYANMNGGLKVWLNETIQAIESSENLDPQITSRIAI
mgnify:FL=1